MKTVRLLRYACAALFTLCAAMLLTTSLAPREAHADELEEILATGRFVVVLEVTGHKRASKINDDFFDIFAVSQKHIVDGQGFFDEIAESAGVPDENPWESPDLLGQITMRDRVDAVIVPTLDRVKKKYIVTVRVYNGANGNLEGEFEVNLGRKYSINDEHKEEILANADPLITQTGWALKEYYERPQLVEITVTSDPTGADVLREGQVLGQTPLKTEVEFAEVEEVWELSYQGQPAGIVRVDLRNNNSYAVPLQGLEPPEPETGPLAAVMLGSSRPLLEVGVGTDLTTRSLEVTTSNSDSGGSGLTYSSPIYPILNIELDFFPLAFAVADDYISSIGVFANFGYGRAGINSSIPIFPDDESSITDNTLQSCTISDPSAIGNPGIQTVMDCPTTHIEFAFGATFRLLLEDAPEGEGLDPNGMMVSASLGYESRDFDIDRNPTYEGHGYQGILIALGFHTPIGLPELRLDVGFHATPLLTFGSGDQIGQWGRTASGFGLGGLLEVSYDIYEGLYAKAGFDANYYITSYEGFGCVFQDCRGVDTNASGSDVGNSPDGTYRLGSEAGDFFGQILIQLGYRLK